MLAAWGDISPLFRSHFFDGQHDSGLRLHIVVGGLGFRVSAGPVCHDCLGVVRTLVADWSRQFPSLTVSVVPLDEDESSRVMLWCADCGWNGSDGSRHDCGARRTRWAVPR